MKQSGILFIFLSIFDLRSFSQEETSVDFINQVYLTIVDSSFTNYYLSDSFTIISNLEDELLESRPDKRHIMDYKTLQEFILKSHQQIPGKWDCGKIKKSICVNDDTIPVITGTRAQYVLNDEWSEEKKEFERERQLEEQRKIWRSKPEQEKYVYFFSKPIFSEHHNIAIVSLARYCGMRCALSCIYTFKKVKGKWIRIDELFCLVS
jgi:hypothetical protein